MNLRITRRQFLKICGSTLAVLHLPSALKALATGRASEGLLFRASFDLGADADYASGSGVAESAGVRFWRVLDAGGQAMVAYPGSVLRYASTGNVLVQRGTIELGIKPLIGFKPDSEHRFVVITDAHTSSAIYVEATAGSPPNLRVRLQSDSGEYTVVASSAMREWLIGEWHHVAVTWDDSVGQAVLYVDGVMTGNAELNATPLSLEGSLLIGGDEDAAGRIYKLGGQTSEVVIPALPQVLYAPDTASSPTGSTSAFSEIDDVRVYDYARSATEIRADYAQFRADLRANDRANWSPGVPSLVSLEMVPRPEFAFVVLTDTHIGEPGDETKYAHNWRVEHVIDQINALKPEFVVNCGDMITYWPNDARFAIAGEEALRLHATFDMPVYYVPGNHDVGNKQSMSIGNIVTESTITAYREHFGPDYYSFDFRDCHFIVLNAQIFNSDLPAASEQWQWLLTDLEATRNSHLTFMLLHIPLFWVNQDDPGPGNYEVMDEPARSELTQLINTYHIDAVFTGHTHHSIANRVENTELLTAPSTTFARDFGKNYEVPSNATIYDEWKVGYQVVRVPSEGFVVNQVAIFPHAYPAQTIQRDNSLPQKRFLNRIAKEIEDNVFGLVAAPVPEIQHMWAPAFVVDGEFEGEPEELAWRGWVSGAHTSPTDEEWIAVELSEERVISRVEIAPRPGGWHFPVDFVVEARTDGDVWTVVVEEENYPRPGSWVSFAFTARSARFVRLRSMRMGNPDTPPYRMSIMEFRILGADGVNYATWGKCSAKTNAIQRLTVDDQAWHLPSEVGAKWVRISPDAFDWSAIESRRGIYHIDPAQDRALSIGMPAGVNLVMLLTTHNPLYSQGEQREAFGAYVRFLAQRFAHRIAAWEVVYDGQPAAEFVGLVDEARQQLMEATASPYMIAGPFSILDAAIVQELADRVDAVVVEALLSAAGDGDVQAQLQAWRRVVEQLDSPVELWLQIALGDANDLGASVMIKRLARAFIVLQELGVRFFWSHVPGTPGGLLDRMFDPTELYYTVQTLTTLFDSSVLSQTDFDVKVENAGSDIESFTFAGHDRVYIVCWQTRIPGYDDVAEVVDLIIDDRNYTKLMAVDTLSCVGQELNWSKEAGGIRIPGLFVRDYPTVVVLWPADHSSVFLPLITKGSSS